MITAQISRRTAVSPAERRTPVPRSHLLLLRNLYLYATWRRATGLWHLTNLTNCPRLSVNQLGSRLHVRETVSGSRTYAERLVRGENLREIAVSRTLREHWLIRRGAARRTPRTILTSRIPFVHVPTVRLRLPSLLPRPRRSTPRTTSWSSTMRLTTTPTTGESLDICICFLLIALR